MCFSLYACDAGIKFVGYEIATYPDKLFYVIGIDKELNFDGGTVYYITQDDNRKRDRLIAQPMGDFERAIKHEIDFNTEGVYVVEINSEPGYPAFFAIQVVSFGEIKRMAESGAEQ